MEVIVYRCTGRHNLFSVPKKYCEECDLTIALVKKEIENKPAVKLTVKSWFDNIFESLLKGGWHCPVVTIDGKLVSQGKVPSPDLLKQYL